MMNPISEETSASVDLSSTTSGTTGSNDNNSARVLVMTSASTSNPVRNAAEETSPLREVGYDPFSSTRRWMTYIDGFIMIVITMVLVSFGITVALIVEISNGVRQVTPHGGLISSDRYCSDLGGQILLQSPDDASTVDAAITTALCLSVLNPHAAGIGGGGYAVVHNQKSTVDATEVYDFREVSPRNTNAQDFEGKTAAEIAQPLTVGVPGFVRGMQLLHNKYGRLEWFDVVMTASRLAADGVPVTAELAAAIQSLPNSDILKALITNATTGQDLAEGDLLVQPELADTLKQIALDPETFYSGSLSENITGDISKFGGVLVQNDMYDYSVDVSYNVQEIVFSGVKLVIAAVHRSLSCVFDCVMRVMETYISGGNNPQYSQQEQNLMMHRLSEALKHGFAQLTLAGHNYNGTDFSTSNMTSEITSQINDTTTYPLDYYLHGYEPVVFNSDQSQFVSVIGPDRIAVTIVMSLGSSFGSHLMTNGFVLNNAMLDFSWEGKSNLSGVNASQSNYVSGGVRPLSSLLPVIAIPPDTKCGEYILPDATAAKLAVSGMAEYFLFSAVFNESMSESVDKKRIHQQLSDFLDTEAEIDDDWPGLIAYLEGLGHRIRSNVTMGTVNVMSWLDEQTTAVLDPTRSVGSGNTLVDPFENED